MRQPPTLLLAALAVGLASGVALRESDEQAGAVPELDVEESGWAPGPVARLPNRSARQLDAEQPDVREMRVRPQAIVAPLLGEAARFSYRNCAAARAAGAAPLRRDEPGYGPHLDRDNDGIACEPYYGP